MYNHSYLSLGDQVFVLPVETLEEYYPDQVRAEFAFINKKVKLAKKIGESIDKSDFENHMKIVYDALMACFEKAY